MYLIKTDSSGNSGCVQGGTTTFVTSPNAIVSGTTTKMLPLQTFIGNTQTAINKGIKSFDACSFVGIEDLKSENIVIYPNPSDGIFTISTNEKSEYIKITISTVLGNIVYSNLKFTYPERVDISALPAGTYFLQYSQGGRIHNSKILVNK